MMEAESCHETKRVRPAGHATRMQRGYDMNNGLDGSKEKTIFPTALKPAYVYNYK